MLLNFALVFLIGFAAHRASLCTVRAVMQWMNERKAGILLSFAKAVAWACLLSGVFVLLGLPVKGVPLTHSLWWVSIAGGFLFGMGAAINGGCSLSTLQKLADGDTIELGSLRIEVVATPGHTHDAICLVLPGRVLTGDTLLIGGVGRTDLPTGNSRVLFESLQKLIAMLPDDTIILPAHDYEGRKTTTVGREKSQNPRLQIKTAQEFIAEMDARQSNLPPPAMLREALNTNQKCL